MQEVSEYIVIGTVSWPIFRLTVLSMISWIYLVYSVMSLMLFCVFVIFCHISVSGVPSFLLFYLQCHKLSSPATDLSDVHCLRFVTLRLVIFMCYLSTIRDG